LLGGWLAQRQAALREGMAAGAFPTFTLGHPCVPVSLRAASVPWKEVFWKLRTIRCKRPRFSLHHWAVHAEPTTHHREFRIGSRSDRGHLQTHSSLDCARPGRYRSRFRIHWPTAPRN